MRPDGSSRGAPACDADGGDAPGHTHGTIQTAQDGTVVVRVDDAAAALTALPAPATVRSLLGPSLGAIRDAGVPVEIRDTRGPIAHLGGGGSPIAHLVGRLITGSEGVRPARGAWRVVPTLVADRLPAGASGRLAVGGAGLVVVLVLRRALRRRSPG